MGKDLIFDADFDAMFAEDLPQLQPSPYTSSEYTISELASEFEVSERQIRTLSKIVQSAYDWLDSQSFLQDGKYTEFARSAMIAAREYEGTYDDWILSIHTQSPKIDPPKPDFSTPITHHSELQISESNFAITQLQSENDVLEAEIISEISTFNQQSSDLKSFLSAELKLMAEREALLEFQAYERAKLAKFAALQRAKKQR